ncbi:hypothetical protein [Aquibacillus saliphilus]|nr:hypothetical protein [Aquibacillus saliphilus]
MQQSHGMGFAEYGRKLSQLLKVEQKREASYRKSLETSKEMERQMHR